MRSFTLFLLSASILGVPACGGDPVESTTGTDSTTGGSTGPATTSTTNPTSASTTGMEEPTTAGTDTSNTAPTTNPTTGGPETTGTSSTSESGTTTTDGTTGPVETTTGGTTTGGTTTGGTTTTDGMSTGGTTGEFVCIGLPAMECMANEACMPLGGGKLNLQKMCVQKPMFLGCVDAGACGDALTYGCDSAVDPPEPYLFPSTCLPDGWEPCEAPPIDMPCK